MKVHTIGVTAKINDVAPGTCLAFHREGTTYLALRLQEKTVATALWPKHPGGKLPLGQFSIDDNFHRNESLWVLPEAIAAPSQITLSAVRYPAPYKQQLGSLILFDSECLVTVPYRDEVVAWVKLSKGQLVYQLPEAFVWFEQWSVMLSRPDGSQQIICTVPELKPAIVEPIIAEGHR